MRTEENINEDRNLNQYARFKETYPFSSRNPLARSDLYIHLFIFTTTEVEEKKKMFDRNFYEKDACYLLSACHWSEISWWGMWTRVRFISFIC